MRQVEIVKFKATDGGVLDGFISRYKENNDTILIQIHGMTSNCFKERDKIISEEVGNIGLDILNFNNRGSDVCRYLKKQQSEEEVVELAGTSHEDIQDSYYDILGAMQFVIEKGYRKIYLQGHSLGSSKIVYTYTKLKKENNKILNKIKGIILLSLVDLPGIFKESMKEEYFKYINEAEEKEKNNKMQELMPQEAFIHPISVKTFLRYTKYNKNINFAQYENCNYDYKELNEIKEPLFMRWGDTNEFIIKSAEEQVKMMNKVIKNSQKDICYIKGANHSYSGKEKELSVEISNFIKRTLD